MNLRGGNVNGLVRWSQIGVGAAIFTLFSLIWFGFADPVPLRDPIEIRIDSIADCDAFSSLLLVDIGTLQLDFAFDHSFAVQIGGVDQPGFELFVNPIGYLSITAMDDVIQPLATFPHVKQDRNEIWIDWVDSTATAVRINRELYWQGKIPLENLLLNITCST